MSHLTDLVTIGEQVLALKDRLPDWLIAVTGKRSPNVIDVWTGLRQCAADTTQHGRVDVLADCLLYVLAGARRVGISPAQLFEHAGTRGGVHGDPPPAVTPAVDTPLPPGWSIGEPHYIDSEDCMGAPAKYWRVFAENPAGVTVCGVGGTKEEAVRAVHRQAAIYYEKFSPVTPSPAEPRKHVQGAPEFDDVMPRQPSQTPRPANRQYRFSVHGNRAAEAMAMAMAAAPVLAKKAFEPAVAPVAASWPAAWEHVGPPEAPWLKNIAHTLAVLREYVAAQSRATGWPVPSCDVTEIGKEAILPEVWAELKSDDPLFCLDGVVYLTKQDLISLPDPRGVLWSRYLEWWRLQNTYPGKPPDAAGDIKSKSPHADNVGMAKMLPIGIPTVRHHLQRYLSCEAALRGWADSPVVTIRDVAPRPGGWKAVPPAEMLFYVASVPAAYLTRADFDSDIAVTALLWDRLVAESKFVPKSKS